MGKSLDQLEQKILANIQHGMPLSQRPYGDLADKIGISTEHLLETLSQWKTEGKIRRLGAIVNHFQMGHGAGAMVVWNVPDDKVEAVGVQFASLSKVSHAYQRPARDNWHYTLYTMVHASDADELDETILAMSRQSGITDFRRLQTIKELKKVPPTYIGPIED